MGRQSGEPQRVFSGASGFLGRRWGVALNNLVLELDLVCVCRNLMWKAIKLNRTIRTGKLKPLLAVHARPINVVVFHGSDSETWF